MAYLSVIIKPEANSKIEVAPGGIFLAQSQEFFNKSSKVKNEMKTFLNLLRCSLNYLEGRLPIFSKSTLKNVDFDLITNSQLFKVES